MKNYFGKFLAHPCPPPSLPPPLQEEKGREKALTSRRRTFARNVEVVIPDFFLSSNGVCFSVLWNPSGDGTQLITLSDQHLKIWQLDVDAQVVKVIGFTD